MLREGDESGRVPILWLTGKAPRGGQGVWVFGQGRDLSSLRVSPIRLPRLGTDNPVARRSAVEVVPIQRVRNREAGTCSILNLLALAVLMVGLYSSQIRGLTMN